MCEKEKPDSRYMPFLRRGIMTALEESRANVQEAMNDLAPNGDNNIRYIWKTAFSRAGLAIEFALDALNLWDEIDSPPDTGVKQK